MAGEPELGEELLGAAVDASLSRGARLLGVVHVATPGEASTLSMAREPQGRAVAAPRYAGSACDAKASTLQRQCCTPPPPYEIIAPAHIWSLELELEKGKERSRRAAPARPSTQ